MGSLAFGERAVVPLQGRVHLGHGHPGRVAVQHGQRAVHRDLARRQHPQIPADHSLGTDRSAGGLSADPDAELVAGAVGAVTRSRAGPGSDVADPHVVLGDPADGEVLAHEAGPHRAAGELPEAVEVNRRERVDRLVQAAVYLAAVPGRPGRRYGRRPHTCMRAVTECVDSLRVSAHNDGTLSTLCAGAVK